MLLKCSNLNFKYPESDIPVIDSLSFSMKSPGFKAIFGPSGVGKTTVAKLLAQKEDPVDKAIITENINTILYSYNLERLPGWSSIGNHLDKVTSPEKETLKHELTGVFRLNDFLNSRFSRLSMGQQNRINLIRYLVQDFDLLILDESLANVDEKLRETIILSMKELFPDKMFLYISHNLMEVSKFCSDILVLSEPSKKQGYSMIAGQDYKKNFSLDKTELDAAMLEIMNAF